MATRGKTIEIFMPDGDYSGIKIATLTNHAVEVTCIPRNKLGLAKQLDSLDRVGTYILVKYDKNGHVECYIGEAENCLARFGQHDAEKDFWHYAFAITSKTNHFTKAHVKYLEYLCYDTAKQENRCTINNGNIPAKPHVSVFMEADLLDCFDAIDILTASLGLSIFQPFLQNDAIAQPLVIVEQDEAISPTINSNTPEAIKKANIDSEMDRLAQLPELDYERERAMAAKRLEIRPSFLDRLVKEQRIQIKSQIQGGTGRIDQFKLLDTIMQHIIKIPKECGYESKSIAELCENVHKMESAYEEHQKILGDIGIRVMKSKIYIANNNNNLEEILKHTVWRNNWTQTLKRLPDAKSADKVIYFSMGCKSRAIEIPIERVLKQDKQIRLDN
ncbi:MAG: GIY-YIG nuclease family protein [Pseudomonadota bacterium]|nr:GIY-YIG nuclease family protein [Pseudomonadota bacterium]MDE3036973.1 GIY-YIG nuclease family protein [Pseudomonadota bacterium]